MRSRHCAPDDHLLNLRGALEDREDLGVPMPPLDRALACGRSRRGSGSPARSAARLMIIGWI
jgi:hypothetical protein